MQQLYFGPFATKTDNFLWMTVVFTLCIGLFVSQGRRTRKILALHIAIWYLCRFLLRAKHVKDQSCYHFDCPSQVSFAVCRRMLVKQKDERSVAKFTAKLADHARKLDGVFVHYDADAGNWIMKVDHF